MSDARLENDAAYLRRLAQAGRTGQPLGGLLLAAFGFFVALGAAALWARSGVAAFSALAGFLVFASIACTDASPSRRRLMLAGAASLAAALALFAIYRVGMWAIVQFAHDNPDTWRSADRPLFWLLLMAIPPTLIAGLVAAAAVIAMRLRRHPAALAPGNVVAGAVWSGGMLAMAAIIAVYVLQTVTLEDRFQIAFAAVAGMPDAPADPTQISINAARIALFSAIPAMFWIVWGLAWWVWGLTSGRRWALLVAAGSVAVALCYIATMAVFPTSVAGLVLLAFLPGLILAREARRDDGWD